MSDVTESLPALISRRMGELGVKSVRQLHRRLPGGDDRITYETTRLLQTGEQKGTKDPRVPRDLALMLDVSENEVREAMLLPPTYGEWEIPARAQILTPEERKVVMSVVDALISARGTGGLSWESGDSGPEDEAAPEVARPKFGAGSKRDRMIQQAMPVTRAARNVSNERPKK